MAAQNVVKDEFNVTQLINKNIALRCLQKIRHQLVSSRVSGLFWSGRNCICS